MFNVVAYVFLVLISCLSSGCVTTSSTLGTNVSVFVPPQLVENGECGSVSLLSFSKDNVSVSDGVPAKLKNIVKETFFDKINTELAGKGRRFVMTQTIPNVGEFHVLKVTVNRFEITEKVDGGYISKTGNASMGINIIQAGTGSICMPGAADYEARRQVRSFESEKLPSDEKFVEIIASRVIGDLVSYVSPHEKFSYRPLRSGSCSLVSSCAKHIDSGNCQMAIDILKNHLEEKPGDLDAMYNAGVALECLARKEKIENKKEFRLRKANKYYEQVLLAQPDREDVAKAKEQVTATLDILTRNQRKRVEAEGIASRMFVDPEQANY